MKLVMYFGNDFIAAVDVKADQITLPGYIGKLKRKLLEENKKFIDASPDEIEFLLVTLTSRKN